VVDKIVAVVNDQSITNSEIENAMKPLVQQLKADRGNKAEIDKRMDEARKEVIERLVEEKLILQEAKKLKVEVKDEEIEERVQLIKSKFPDEQSFQIAMSKQAVNMWELKKVYKDQIMVKKMVRQYVRGHLKIAPTQIADYYQKHINEFNLPDAVWVAEILIKYKPYEESLKTERTAAQVMDLLSAGADFEVVARKYSEGPNAADGGDIGWVERGAMTAEVDSVIFGLKEGEHSNPIKTNVGIVIFKVKSVRTERFKPLETVKPDIEELLLDQNAKLTIDKWIKELKEKAYISVKE
jgi:peptidyl-prolyl cis-trans isomerase SurA